MPYPTSDKTKQGFITIELILAFAILLINISGILILVNGGEGTTLRTKLHREALHISREKIEEARVLAELDFNLLNNKTQNIDIYLNELKVTDIDLFTKEIDSITSWHTTQKRKQETRLTTLITNPKAYTDKNTCSSILTGDWQNPEKTEYEFGKDLLKDTSSGFPITDIEAFNQKLYITVNNTSGNFPGTFFIFDISNPDSAPVLISPKNFDNSSVGEGLSALALDHRGYAYVSSGYTSASQNCVEAVNCAQLQVMDISQLTSPSVIRNFKLPSFTSGGKLTASTAISYSNNVVYLGTTRAGSSTAEFFSIDVRDPRNPQVLDSFKLGNGVNDILIKNNFAYIASPNTEELKILDISDPGNLLEVGGFNAPGGGGNNGNGKSLASLGNQIYFGRTLLNGDELYILDNSNPKTSLPVLGSRNINFFGVNSSVNGILVRDFLTFIITNGGLEILNTRTPNNTTPYTAPIILPPGTGAGLSGTALDCEGNHIFIASKNANNVSYLSIITAR